MQDLSKSRFNMWRAVIAVIHADQVVRPHEINFVLENLDKVEMSPMQREMLVDDLSSPFDLMTAFAGITREKDREDFFHLAAAAAWSDGDMNAQESKVLKTLKALQQKQHQTAGGPEDVSYIGVDHGQVKSGAAVLPKLLDTLKRGKSKAV